MHIETRFDGKLITGHLFCFFLTENFPSNLYIKRTTRTASDRTLDPFVPVKPAKPNVCTIEANLAKENKIINACITSGTARYSLKGKFICMTTSRCVTQDSC